jgi:low temperature requirement protein LtrA
MATADEPARVLRDPLQSQRVDFFELIFDVVFVFAFTELSQRLYNGLTWYGFYRALVLLLAMWWIWYRLAWTTNRYNPTQPAIRLMVLATMLATLLMSTTLPHTFVNHQLGVVFGSTYVAVEVGRHLWLVLLGGNRHAQLVSVRVLFWAALSAPLWIAGVFSPAVPRLALWSVAVAVDYAGGMLDFPTPRLGRAGLRGQRVAGAHLVERYQQVLIIAFGETILSSGIEFAPYAFQGGRTAALVVSFAITLLLVRIYIFRAGAMLPQAIAATKAPAYIGELASYAHLTMAAGIIVNAVGDKVVIAHPLVRVDLAGRLVIIGGSALFLVGRAALDYATFSRVSRTRPVGIILLAAAVPATAHLQAVGVAAVTAAVLASIATGNWVSWLRNPREPLPPRTRSGRAEQGAGSSEAGAVGPG